MACHRLMASAVVALTVAGCAAEQTGLVAAGGLAAPLPAVETPAVPRFQKPDQEPSARAATGNVLDSGSLAFPTSIEGKVAVRIRAHVNGKVILDDEVRETTYQALAETMSLPEPQRTARQKEIIEKGLEHLIERELILDDAMTKLKKLRPQALEKLQEAASRDADRFIRQVKSGFRVQGDEELKAALRSVGLSLSGIRRQREREFMATEYMRSRIFPIIERVGHDEVQQYYEEHQSEFQIDDRVKWQDIFLDARQHADYAAARRHAEKIAGRARAGEEFVKLVKEFDCGDSRLRNGDGYGQRRGEIQPQEAEAILFRMRPGDVGPLIEIGTGFHVIRLVEREYAGLRPLNEKTQGEIRKKLQAVIAEREYKRVVADLKRKASIEKTLITDP